ncbi:hypothetical protein [Paenibacillus oleatilyticus]|uniref:hypothetical protein n=1 Tax=Paenibacillus oleatilyticus TaxID=2594886 RepID=UPI001C1F45D4|nr:hypothetical protein [Paenibacillus oleatilyticus]MBU7316047.1 hypothetical protein [Paenibacillus oleatilyticus]
MIDKTSVEANLGPRKLVLSDGGIKYPVGAVAFVKVERATSPRDDGGMLVTYHASPITLFVPKKMTDVDNTPSYTRAYLSTETAVKLIPFLRQFANSEMIDEGSYNPSKQDGNVLITYNQTHVRLLIPRGTPDNISYENVQISIDEVSKLIPFIQEIAEIHGKPTGEDYYWG